MNMSYFIFSVSSVVSRPFCLNSSILRVRKSLYATTFPRFSSIPSRNFFCISMEVLRELYEVSKPAKIVAIFPSMFLILKLASSHLASRDFASEPMSGSDFAIFITVPSLSMISL